MGTLPRQASLPLPFGIGFCKSEQAAALQQLQDLPPGLLAFLAQFPFAAEDREGFLLEVVDALLAGGERPPGASRRRGGFHAAAETDGPPAVRQRLDLV